MNWFLGGLLVWVIGGAALEHWRMVRRQKRDPYWSVNDR